MKQKAIFIGIVILLVLIFNTCTRQSDFPVLTGPYLGQKLPGDVPELFAPGPLAAGSIEYSIAFSPDGMEFCYTLFTPAGRFLAEPTGVFHKWFILRNHCMQYLRTNNIDRYELF